MKRDDGEAVNCECFLLASPIPSRSLPSQSLQLRPRLPLWTLPRPIQPFLPLPPTSRQLLDLNPPLFKLSFPSNPSPFLPRRPLCPPLPSPPRHPLPASPGASAIAPESPLLLTGVFEPDGSINIRAESSVRAMWEATRTNDEGGCCKGEGLTMAGRRGHEGRSEAGGAGEGAIA
jgi:hypothetical protein